MMRQTADGPVVTLNRAMYDSSWDEGQGDIKSRSSPCPHQVGPVSSGGNTPLIHKNNWFNTPTKAKIKV